MILTSGEDFGAYPDSDLSFFRGYPSPRLLLPLPAWAFALAFGTCMKVVQNPERSEDSKPLTQRKGGSIRVLSHIILRQVSFRLFIYCSLTYCSVSKALAGVQM